MGRALYSKVYAPVIRQPSPSPYEKWSISNPFDPDSDSFFEGAQYEAFLPTPLPTTSTREPPRMVINTTRITTTRNADLLPRPQSSNTILDSAHDLSEVETPTSASRSLSEDSEQSRPTLSAMAGDSDSEDPIRMVHELVTEYRRMRRDGANQPHLTLGEILRQMDEELSRGDRQQHEERPQRYLPPLDYPSNSATPSPRADSPASPIFFPSPPSPPPMSREANSISITESFSRSYSSVVEHLDQIENDPLDLDDSSTQEVEEAEAEAESVPASSVSAIPISVPRTALRTPIHIHRGTPGSFGYDVGLDMSPPPSVSPRLYNWSRTRSESHVHYSPSSYTRRSSYIPVTQLGGRI